MTTDPKIGDLRVWWICQVPGKPFYVPVPNLDTAALLLGTLARYDQFQLDNRIKPDYCNAGGLEVFGDLGGDDGPSWSDWYDDETGDDFDQFIARQNGERE